MGIIALKSLIWGPGRGLICVNNVNHEQPLARAQPAARFQVMENRDENPVAVQQSEGIETTNEQAVGDDVGPRVSRLVYLDDILFHAKVFKSM